MNDIKETIQEMYALKTYLASKTIEEHGPARESLIGMQQVVDSAVNLLKEQEPIEPTTYMDGLVQRFACGKCGKHLLYANWGRDNFCSKCGRAVKWND